MHSNDYSCVLGVKEKTEKMRQMKRKNWSVQKILMILLVCSLIMSVRIERTHKILLKYVDFKKEGIRKSNTIRVTSRISTKDKVVSLSQFPANPDASICTHPYRLWAYSDNLPKYIKDYLDWHADQTNSITDAERQQEKQARYLVVQCLKEFPRCGGLSDRLRPLPVYIFAAIQMKRILLFQWTKPCQLEEFFTPPPCGINWTVPSWLNVPQQNRAQITSFKDLLEKKILIGSHSTSPIFTTHIQSGAASLYDNLIFQLYNDSSYTYNRVYRHLFSSFFNLVAPLQSIVDQNMETLNLTTGMYSAVHVRARHPDSGLYPTRNTRIDKEGGFIIPEGEGDYKNKIINTLQTALHCAFSLTANSDTKKLYFVSDSLNVTNFVLNKGLLPLPSEAIVGIKIFQEPLHLDEPQYKKRKPSDFYMTFVDLWLLRQAKCILYGTGGFGRFASFSSVKESECSKNYLASNCTT